ncbi:MAG: protein phosphatase 2C domain-containing protein [Gammaproteobacteria bacterium]|nr:protein phosphatase 2C domain-containing protein [Gammaproteobacteria bacterium]
MGRTDTGRVRAENQDVFAVRDDLGLAVVADGVARPRAGRVAAEVAVDITVEYLAGIKRCRRLRDHDLRKAMETANDRAFGLSCAISAYRGMASTLVVTALDGAKGYVAHVGDSRAYRFRKGVLSGLTKDHNVVQRWVDAGVMSVEQARLDPERHVVTRAIGAERTLRPEIRELDILPRDLLLLCSDGLTEHLDDAEIAHHLATVEDLGEGADRLVDAANDAGGSDNVTVVLIRC